MDNGTGIMPVMNMGANDGFGGGSFMYIFGLLILLGLFNGGFGGFGTNNAGVEAVQADVNRGFDNQNLQAQTRDILSAVTNGTAQSVAATNQTFHDTLTVLNDKYSEIARDIANVQVAQAQALANQNQCCCDTKMLIQETSAQNRYDNAMNTAAINANTTAQIQSIKDMMAQDKIEALQNQINALQLQAAVSGVVRYPMATTYTSGCNPFCGGCGCGNI